MNPLYDRFIHSRIHEQPIPPDKIKKIKKFWNRLVETKKVTYGLYTMASSFTFTSCGSTGREGPELIECTTQYIPGWTDNTAYFNVSGGISSSFSLKELSLWCEKNMFVKKIGRIKRTRFFDVKWIVLDNSFAKKTFKWKIKFSKHKIFQDIYLNDN